MKQGLNQDWCVPARLVRWLVLRFAVEADRRTVQQSCGCVTEFSEVQ